MNSENKLVQWRALNIRIPRTKQNFNKGKYAPLEEILDKVNKPLSEIGLTLIHSLKKAQSGDGLYLHSQLMDGATLLNDTIFPVSEHADPQKVAAGITYARRYNISVLLDIAADDDDDGEQAGSMSKQRPHPTKIERKQPDVVEDRQFEAALAGLKDPAKDSQNIIKWLTSRNLTKEQQEKLDKIGLQRAT